MQLTNHVVRLKMNISTLQAYHFYDYEDERHFISKVKLNLRFLSRNIPQHIYMACSPSVKKQFSLLHCRRHAVTSRILCVLKVVSLLAFLLLFSAFFRGGLQGITQDASVQCVQSQLSRMTAKKLTSIDFTMLPHNFFLNLPCYF